MLVIINNFFRARYITYKINIIYKYMFFILLFFFQDFYYINIIINIWIFYNKIVLINIFINNIILTSFLIFENEFYKIFKFTIIVFNYIF